MSESTDTLKVENLELAYRVRGRDLKVLHRVSLCIRRGESYGLVGESGSGKSTLALALVRYLPPNGRMLAGSILIGGRELLALDPGQLRELRATTVSMVYQDPARALNPSMRIGEQIAEIFRARGENAAAARSAAGILLERVRIGDREAVLERYPHQLSGGMQQRVVIAMALAINPALLILDEPTTSLDATVEVEILDLLGELRRELSTSILFISHNLALVARMCDRVGVLYAGTLVEEGAALEVLRDPRHPYTVGLLRCLPRRGRTKNHSRLDTIAGFPPAPGDVLAGCVFAPRCGLADDKCRTCAPALRAFGARCSRCHYLERAQSLPRTTADELPTGLRIDREEPPLLQAKSLSKTFRSERSALRALHDVSLSLWPGETLGLVGESGSGKTTLARLLVGLSAPDAGGVLEMAGQTLAGRSEAREPEQLQALQIIFQNPDGALNRSHTVRQLIERVLVRLGRLPRSRRAARMLELLRSVRVDERYLDVRPRELSGGLKQRVAIARAFAGAPRIVVCDEPTAALDVSVQAAILNLLTELQARHRVSYVFISHDLGSVRYLSDRIAVLYLGRLLEIGPAERVFSGPHHPYTAALLSAVPRLEGAAQPHRLQGEIPSAIHTPRGCVFHTRCPRKLGPVCEQTEPPLLAGAEPGHEIRCHIPAAELQDRDA
ncbi:MAG TPA: ABC transporter ATP-binding protein [Steroidobacteraceae bacterium]|nr:ABC transporter ATP-binding protein [Steroidobacteraceae bacterium]